jgi:hypothetical protein
MTTPYVTHETVISQLNIIDTRQIQNIQDALAKLQSAQDAKNAVYTQQQPQSAARPQTNSSVSKG